MLIAVERTLPASEREERQGHRNGNVHTHLAHINLVLEPTRRAAMTGKDRGSVAVRAGVDQLDGITKAVNVDAGQHRATDLFVVDIHVRRDFTEQGRPY